VSEPLEAALREEEVASACGLQLLVHEALRY
jgi:hypothetical protein